MTSTYTSRMFYTLLADAVEFTLLAQDETSPHRRAAARAAVLTCAAVLECAANICLHDANLDQDQKRTPVEKLVLYAKQKWHKTVSVENNPTKNVNELRQCRNVLIHRKSTVSDLLPIKGSNEYEYHPTTTPLLRISADPELWSGG